MTAKAKIMPAQKPEAAEKTQAKPAAQTGK